MPPQRVGWALATRIEKKKKKSLILAQRSVMTSHAQPKQEMEAEWFQSDNSEMFYFGYCENGSMEESKL